MFTIVLIPSIILVSNQKTAETIVEDDPEPKDPYIKSYGVIQHIAFYGSNHYIVLKLKEV